MGEERMWNDVNDWLQQFGGTKAFHLSSTTSDHIPLWIVSVSCEPNGVVMKKIDKCGSELTQWSKRNFGNIKTKFGGETETTCSG